MKGKYWIKEIEFFKISRHEKEILCCLKDLMFWTCPLNMEYADGKVVDFLPNRESEKYPFVHLLWDSNSQVIDAFKFTLKQVLTNYNLSRLNTWVDEMNIHEQLEDILFEEYLDNNFYMSFPWYSEHDE